MKIRCPDLSSNPINQEHQQLGLPPVEISITHPSAHPVLTVAVWFTFVVLITLALYFSVKLFFPDNLGGGLKTIYQTIHSDVFQIAVVVGFIAQVIDGALGMAYGITATTFLLSTGSSPAIASASVHIAEIFTTGLSGISHVKFGNVNKQLFMRLLIPGILGAILGSITVTSIDGTLLKPYITAYLLLMGIYILIKAFYHLRLFSSEPKHVSKLALFGGFADAAGGGGWGPIVTTTLIGNGNDPRVTIGSVNFAEFFLTLATAISFTLLIGMDTWPIVAGLVFGGIFAAPFAAVLCKKLHTKLLLILVGLVITLLSIFTLYKTFIF